MSNYNGYAVIWDVDGTLVDTAEAHFGAWVKLGQALGKPFTRADFVKTFGWRNPEIIPTIFGKDYSDAEIAQLGEQKELYYRAEAANGVKLLPGVAELLEGLKAAGFRQAIGSSAPLKNLDLILSVTNTLPYFAAISSAEDTQRGKPDPQVFLVAASKLGLAPEKCLVLEDAVAGIEAAHNAGMPSIAVTFVGHHPAEKLQAAGANLVVPSLSDVTPATIANLLQTGARANGS